MISLHLLQLGHCGMRCDAKYGHSQDMSTPEGVRLWLALICKLDYGALAQFSPRCGPWTLLCQSVHKRKFTNGFLGDSPQYPSVVEANRQMQTTALLMLIAYMIGCDVLFEQSITSCMPKAAPMATTLTHIGAGRQSVSHAAYGAGTKKYMAFFSTSPSLLQLKRKRVDKQYESLVKRSGSKFTGRGPSLRRSENYSPLLGRELAMLFDGSYRGS